MPSLMLWRARMTCLPILRVNIHPMKDLPPMKIPMMTPMLWCYYDVTYDPCFWDSFMEGT
jgi:hypothetical protein